jgi:acyl-CoA synthetase (AMP-forming)/AMP-acid ligase II
MSMTTIERALDLLPSTDFVNAYGLTETSSTIALLDADAHRAAHCASSADERRRLVSVGRAIPTVEVSVRDEHGHHVDGESPGEIWVRGEQVSGEYEGRGSVLDGEGWFHTNDEGWVDAGGYLFVTGRLDDVIVRGGENISPGEIESVLIDHADVVDAACVGVPDDEWGEVVVAAVVRRTGALVSADVLSEHVRARLRGSKVPSRVVFVDRLPYNETGKLLRRDVRTDVMSAISVAAPTTDEQRRG